MSLYFAQRSERQPALFDVFDILGGLFNKMGRQMIHQPPEWHLFSFVDTLVKYIQR